MIERDQRKQQEQEWLVEYTLTEKQLKQLFQNKLDRAAQATRALKKRESKSFDEA